MLDAQRLLDYSENFFGYGNPEANVWFVGIEEAGCRCEQVVSDRLRLWADRFNRSLIVDGNEFHQSLHDCKGNALGRLFTDPVPAQKTWDRLIRLRLALHGHTCVSKEDVQFFRKAEWARSTSESCLIELFPLPSPSVKTWHYVDWTSLEVLQSRRSYESHFGPRRASAIKRLIASYRPSVVIFYGSKWKRWSQITGFRWRRIAQCEVPNTRLQQAGDTLYAVVRHPASRGMNDADFDRIGEHLRSVWTSSRTDSPDLTIPTACPAEESTLDDGIATIESWNSLPMSSRRVNLPLELRLSREEFQRLKRGSIPEETEDKWFVYHEDGWVYFHRSWTGFCIYQLRVVEDGDAAAYRCSEAWVTRDREQYTSEDLDDDRQLLESLLFYRFEIGPDPSNVD